MSPDQTPAVMRQHAPGPHTGGQGMSVTILAVDDNSTIRDLIHLCLTPAGFDVHLANDGLDAIAALQTVVPDAILTDIHMPRMDGFGLIDALRAQEAYRMTPILVLTSEDAAEVKQRARFAGATGWIVKPFEPRQLVRALTMVTG